MVEEVGEVGVGFAAFVAGSVEGEGGVVDGVDGGVPACDPDVVSWSCVD